MTVRRCCDEEVEGEGDKGVLLRGYPHSRLGNWCVTSGRNALNQASCPCQCFLEVKKERSLLWQDELVSSWILAE